MLAYDSASNPLNAVEWAFPLLECIHISTFALSIGTIAIVDLRLLGIGIRHQTAAQLHNDTFPWTLAGLVIVIFSGLLIFTTDPFRYYYNFAFRFKVICLLVAVVYNYTVHRRMALADTPPFWGRLTGCVSLGLWLSVVFAGLFYAFT